MLRKEASEGTELGLKVKETMEKGELVNDEIILELLKTRIS